eukprot:12905757-Prorocentrum_lima.AAC.1
MGAYPARASTSYRANSHQPQAPFTTGLHGRWAKQRRLLFVLGSLSATFAEGCKGRGSHAHVSLRASASS